MHQVFFKRQMQVEGVNESRETPTLTGLGPSAAAESGQVPQTLFFPCAWRRGLWPQVSMWQEQPVPLGQEWWGHGGAGGQWLKQSMKWAAGLGDPGQVLGSLWTQKPQKRGVR